MHRRLTDEAVGNPDWCRDAPRAPEEMEMRIAGDRVLHNFGLIF